MRYQRSPDFMIYFQALTFAHRKRENVP
ncbi:MAG: hypothetical protein RL069_1156, partial [Planctomycetota bacterium]